MSRRLAVLRARGAVVELMPMMAVIAPAPAFADSQRVNLPEMPLAEALERIRDQTGARISSDPDAINDLTSAPVTDARSALAAVRQATHKMKLAVTYARDGSILVVNDIVVVAHRNEAETAVMVRGATSSSRTGVSLRDQPRNIQVISSKLLAEQQAQTIPDALRNAGGVTVSTGNVQGGTSYTVRGLSTGGLVNGLPTNASNSFAAGGTQPIANVERLEVLKGPDAILLGGGSLGGTVNIVTKKPSADERLYVSSEVGSFGAVRATVDANRALTEDKTVSARIIATAASADHNFGGYRGNEDYLFAPSLRYKNAGTDIILNLTTSNQLFGMTPYTLFDTVAKKPTVLPSGVPLIGDEDQFIQIKNTNYDAQVSQDVTSWLTVVGHWQHVNSSLLIRQYSPFAVLAANTLLINGSGTRQSNVNNVVDGYVRLAFKTGSVEHKVIAGGMASNYSTDQYDTAEGGFARYNYMTKTPALKPIATTYFPFANARGYQKSYYAQYYAKYWKLALLASVRKAESLYTGKTIRTAANRYQSNGTLTPTVGVAVEVTNNLSVYGTVAYGFVPSFNFDRFLNLLPDTHTRNAETGFKLDLFDKRALINASWFHLSQGNFKVPDPINTRYYINLPAQLAEGIDVSISGEPVKGLLLSGSFTRTEYTLLTPNNPRLGNTVQLQPRDQYNVYASYRHRVVRGVSAGLGAGVYGRSSAPIDRFGLYRVAPSNQVDLNGFLTVGKLDLNLGVRNLFDRQNYGPTAATTYVPIGEPRTWRLTVGYRFR